MADITVRVGFTLGKLFHKISVLTVKYVRGRTREQMHSVGITDGVYNFVVVVC